MVLWEALVALTQVSGCDVNLSLGPRPAQPRPCPRCLCWESSAFPGVGVMRAAAGAQVVRDRPAAKGVAEPGD